MLNIRSLNSLKIWAVSLVNYKICIDKISKLIQNIDLIPVLNCGSAQTE